MNRKLLSGAAGVFLSIFAGGQSFAGDYAQLAGSARIPAAEAAGMSLDEIVARKFSREGRDNVQLSRSAGGAAGSAVRSSRTARSTSLDAFHVALINKGSSGDERQAVSVREAIDANPAARRQLAASAGLDPEVAETLGLQVIAGHKFNRDADGDDKAPVRE